MQVSFDERRHQGRPGWSIPINESADENSQTEEYLKQYKRKGVQHIAVGTENIHASTDRVGDDGIEFMPAPPAIYYDKSFHRVPGHQEPIDEMNRHDILIDGKGVVNSVTTRILLQIFSKTVIGPIFFELIQRNGDDSFGEGNLKALFEPIEENQVQSGVLKTEG